MKKGLITTTVFFVLALILALLAVRPTLAQAEAMGIANSLYANGRYAEAAQSYEQLIAQGAADSAIYYNLGSAYFRQGDVGRAILNYRRAAELNPRDADIQANLAAARAQAVDQLPAESGSPLTDFANATGNWLTLDELALLALGAWFLLGLLWFVYRQSGNGRFRPILQTSLILAGLLVVVVGGAMGSRLMAANGQLMAANGRAPGVIVAQSVSVSAEPAAGASTEFTLHSGAEVSLIGQRGDWVQIAFPGVPSDSWVPVTAVETVMQPHGQLS